MKRPLALIGIAIGCVMLTGCHQKVSENGSLTVSFQAWAPLLVVVLGLGAIPAGIVTFSRGHKFRGIALAVFGPLAAGAIAPGMYLDKVVVDQNGFYARHGFWWNPSIHEIRYADLDVVKVVVEDKTRKGRKTYSYSFDCIFKNGKKDNVPLGDLMSEALPEIIEKFQEHGVPVELPANMPRD